MSDNKSKLCRLCAKIDIVSLIGGLEAYTTRSVKHHPSYAALLEATRFGCELCTLFQATLTPGPRHSVSQASGLPPPLSRSSTTFSSGSESESKITTDEAISWHQELDKSLPSAGYTLEVKAESTPDTDFANQYVILLRRQYIPGSSDVGEAVLSRRLLLSNDYDLGLGIRNREIGKFPSFTIYSDWIRSCAHGGKHTRCVPAEPVELPSRVIDVGGGSGSEVPRLIETKGMKGYYITLSHCWGKTRPLMTKLENYASHKSGLPFSHFPKQFQDAALITKIMGYRYLWIDSLCIIQDSSADWDLQCVRMGDIYRNSVCTLAAPIATSSETGLLHARPPPPVPSCKLRALRADELVGYISVGIPPADFKERGSPLASRAWVLQEQLMSPRTLYFASRGMYFQCHSHELLETYHRPLAPEMLTPWRTPEAGDMPKTIIKMAMDDDVTYWYAVVRQYCYRYLSYGDDKLPALSGLAGFVARRAGEEGEEDEGENRFGEYLAGLWEKDLARGLLWVTAATKAQGAKALHEVDRMAPSWSWAAQNLPVDWKVLKELKPQLEYLSSKIELAGANKFGRVKKGVLEVRGNVAGGVLRRATGTSKPVILCASENDPREAAEVMLDATARAVLEQKWKASKQTFACRVLRVGHAETLRIGKRWYGLLLCSTSDGHRLSLHGHGHGHMYQRLGVVTSLGVGIAHERSLSTEQSWQWLDLAKSEKISIS